MNITYANYPAQKSTIDFSKLPKEVTAIVPNLSALDDYHELYNDDETIAKAFDLVMDKINASNFVKEHIIVAKMPTHSPAEPFTQGSKVKFRKNADVKFHVGDMPEKWAYGKVESVESLVDGKFVYRVNGYFEEDGKVLKMDAKHTQLDEIQLYPATGEQFAIYAKRYKDQSSPKSPKSPDKATTTHIYKLGDKYRSDFDYEGMLRMGLKANVRWGVEKLTKLYDSFEDVNYHKFEVPLWDAILSLKYKGKDGSRRDLGDPSVLINKFHKLIIDELGQKKEKNNSKIPNIAKSKKVEHKPYKGAIKIGDTVEYKEPMPDEVGSMFVVIETEPKTDWCRMKYIEEGKKGGIIDITQTANLSELKLVKGKQNPPKVHASPAAKAIGNKPKKEPEKITAKPRHMAALIPEDVKLLRRVKNLIGKRKAKQEFINVHKAIERADVERKVTKNSQFVDELNFSLEWIERCIGVLDKTDKESDIFEMADKTMQAAIIEAANGYAVLEAVKILKQYIIIQGRVESRVAAQKLYDRINKYEKEGPKALHYAGKLKEVKTELENYLNHQKTVLNMSSTTLSGITSQLGCGCTLSDLGYVEIPSRLKQDMMIPPRPPRRQAGMGNIGDAGTDSNFNFATEDIIPIDNEEDEPEPFANNYNGGVPASQIKANTNTFTLGGEIGKFLGPIALVKYAVILKAPRGGGKSRLQLMIGNAFLSRFPRVDYFCMEMDPENPVIKKEYIEKYIQPNSLSRLVVHRSATIAKVREVAKTSRVILIDSWGKLGCRIEEYEQLIKDYPGTAFVIIFQSTGEGTTRGGISAEYDCSELISIFPSKDFRETYAQKEKSRYTACDKQFNLFEQKVIG